MAQETQDGPLVRVIHSVFARINTRVRPHGFPSSQNFASLRLSGALRSAPIPALDSFRARYLTTPVWAEPLRHRLTVAWQDDPQDHLLGY
jgi:hypothetical protein